nr:iron ABC transporter permease [Nocardioides thalensis]
MCGSVALGSLVIGIPTAWLVTRARLPWAGFWRVVAALPLAMPSYVAAYAWLTFVPGLHGYWGTVLVLTLVSAPYVTLPVAAVLRRADTDVEDVARTLGMGPTRAAVATLLPQVLPAATAGALLAALYALSDFGAPALMRHQVFTYGIQHAYKIGFDRTLAAVMALVLAAMALAVVLGERLFRGRAERRGASGSGGVPAPPRSLGRGLPVALALLGIVAVATLGVPAAALAVQSAESLSTGVVWDELGGAAAQTVALSAAGAALTVLLALPIGILAGRFRGRVAASIESASYLGNAIPGIVVGLALVFLTINLLPGLYQTSVALAAAYAVMFLPKAVGAVRTGVQQVPRDVEEAARVLGRGPVRVWATVTARIASPGIAAGALLVMLTAMKELPATLMLRPIGVETLATELWSKSAVGSYGAAAPYAVSLVLVAALPAYLLSRPGTERGAAS